MNTTRPQDWSSNQSTWQPKKWRRTPALSELVPPTPLGGAASGRVWTHNYNAEQYALQSALSVPRNNQIPRMGDATMGDIFDGCTQKNEMIAFLAASKWDSFWKGTGIGVVVGLGLATAGVYLIKR